MPSATTTTVFRGSGASAVAGTAVTGQMLP